MGFERYCYICGCPTTDFFFSGHVSIPIKKLKTWIEKYKLKYKKSQIENDTLENIIFTLFEKKIINQVEYTNLEKSINQNPIHSKYQWLSDLCLLRKNGNVENIKPENTWEGWYISKNGTRYNASFILGKHQEILDYQESYYKKRQLEMYDPKSKHFFGNGYVVHKQCYQMVNKFISNFNFNHLLLQKIDYSHIYPYMLQEVPWVKYFLNERDYFLEDPCENAKNKERILNIIQTLKFIY